MRNHLLLIMLFAVGVVAVVWATSQQMAPVQRNDVPVDRDVQKPMPENHPRSIRDKIRERLFAPKRDELGEGTKRGNGKHAVPENTSPDPQPQIFQKSVLPESVYLKEIASVLSIPVSDRDTPGDIAFKIRQRLKNTESYRGSVLTDESFAKAKSAIRIPEDAVTFTEYHAFIKKIAGKKLCVFGGLRDASETSGVSR